MRIITDNGRSHLRDDAHTSDYMAILQMLQNEIEKVQLIKDPWFTETPRDYDVVLRFDNQEFILPLHFV